MKLEIVKESKKKNGDTVWTFEFDDEFKNIVKDYYKRKRFSKRLGKKFILEAIHESLRVTLLEELKKEYLKSLKINKIK